MEAEEAIKAARAQVDAARCQEARATEEADKLAEERARLDAVHAATAEAQHADLEARLRANQEDVDVCFGEAKRRSEAEVARRIALVESREGDARVIAVLRNHIDEQGRE